MILMIICVNSTHSGYAQWTETDSLWLKRALTESDTIRLNPETMRAIREGSLIRPEDARPELRHAPPILPITKEFVDVGVPDPLRKEIDPDSLPVEAYKRRELYESDSLPTIDKGAFTFNESFAPKDWKRIGKSPVSVKAGGQNLFIPEVKDGQSRGSVGASVRATFSLNDILLYIFRPEERQKRKNRKRAENLKYYNELP